MFCPGCGQETPAEARFCAMCGTQIGVAAQAAAAGAGSGSGGGTATAPLVPPRARVAGGKLLTDLKSLGFADLFPLRQWISEKPWKIGWIQALAFLAFYPVALVILSDNIQAPDLTSELKTSAWSLGLYFAVIWGAIFYRTVKPGRIDTKIVLSTFFFTALIGVTLVP